MLVRQWFDDYFPSDRYLDQVQFGGNILGLYASCSYFHEVLEQEVKLVRKENVILWGSRQGGAVALSTLLTWEEEPFAAVIGMDAWLPWNTFVWKYANGDNSDLLGDEWSDPDTY